MIKRKAEPEENVDLDKPTFEINNDEEQLPSENEDHEEDHHDDDQVETS